MGHQAFMGEKNVRKTPPKVIDPSDYSSVAWLCSADTEKLDDEDLWTYIKYALYLTYHLHVGH